MQKRRIKTPIIREQLRNYETGMAYAGLKKMQRKKIAKERKKVGKEKQMKKNTKKKKGG